MKIEMRLDAPNLSVPGTGGVLKKREVGLFVWPRLSWAVADGWVTITKPPLKFSAGGL